MIGGDVRGGEVARDEHAALAPLLQRDRRQEEERLGFINMVLLQAEKFAGRSGNAQGKRDEPLTPGLSSSLFRLTPANLDCRPGVIGLQSPSVQLKSFSVT